MTQRLVLFLILAVSCFCLQAQLSSPLPSGSRGQAMGGTGLTFQDIHAAWGNPAGIGSIEATTFALFGEQRFSISDLRQISAAGALPLGSGVGGIVVSYYGFESYNESRIGLLYGRKLSEKLRLGGQLYTLGTRIPEYGNKQLLGFELGIQAEVSHSISLGARVANPVQVKLLEDEALPAVMSVGIRYQPGSQVLLFGEVEKDILFPVRVRAGLEYQLLKTLVLRAGIATAPSLMTFGIGYELMEHWRLDFSAAYHQYLGFTPGVSVVYTR